VKSANDARVSIARMKPGSTATVRVLRGTKTLTLTVPIKQQPAGL
jgi:S1-C subfamily serine protease